MNTTSNWQVYSSSGPVATAGMSGESQLSKQWLNCLGVTKTSGLNYDDRQGKSGVRTKKILLSWCSLLLPLGLFSQVYPHVHTNLGSCKHNILDFPIRTETHLQYTNTHLVLQKPRRNCCQRFWAKQRHHWTGWMWKWMGDSGTWNRGVVDRYRLERRQKHNYHGPEHEMNLTALLPSSVTPFTGYIKATKLSFL